MTNTNTLLVCAVAGLLTGCSDYVATLKRDAAHARGADEPCFGIAKAGHNDCKTASVICAGWSSQDRDPTAYVYLPAGTCAKIVGGRVGPTG
jgi:uncharacterized membrane protein